jgi:hypothetical protein
LAISLLLIEFLSGLEQNWKFLLVELIPVFLILELVKIFGKAKLLFLLETRLVLEIPKGFFPKV